MFHTITWLRAKQQNWESWRGVGAATAQGLAEHQSASGEQSLTLYIVFLSVLLNCLYFSP